MIRFEKGTHLPSPGSRFDVCFFVIFRGVDFKSIKWYKLQTQMVN